MSNFIKTSPRFAGKQHLVVSQPIAGPFQEANSSQGNNSTWIFWVDSTNLAHLSILPNLNPELSPQPSYTLDVDWSDVRRVSCAVDQNSRRVVAWQKPTGTTISYIQTGIPETENRVTFSGVDPVLVWDGIMYELNTSTDIILFYLDSTRTSVKYRLQSDLYSVEYNYVALQEASTLDGFKIVGRELCLAGQYELSQDFWETRTSLYPVYVLEDTSFNNQNTKSGNYSEIIIQRDNFSETSTTKQNLGRGSYLPLGQFFDDVKDVKELLQQSLNGEYVEKTVVRDVVTQNSTLIQNTNNGNYFKQILGSGDEIFQNSNLDSSTKNGVFGEVTIVRDTYSENSTSEWRIKSGSYLEVGQFFDPLQELNSQEIKLLNGNYALRSVQIDFLVDAGLSEYNTNRGIYFEYQVRRDNISESSSLDFRIKNGTLNESDRITYQTENGSLNFGRITGNLAQVNIKNSGDILTDSNNMSFSIKLGEYKLAPTVFFFVSPQTPFINPTSDEEWMYFWGDYI